MVLTHSNRIPRVLLYSGYPPSKIIFVYETVTLYRPAFQLCSTNDSLNYAGPNPFEINFSGLGSFAFAHHYLRNRLFTFFSSGYLDVSVPRVPFIHPIYSDDDTAALPAVSFLIRKSTGQSSFAAHRSLSQLVTSFFGAWCQGIHHMPLLALIIYV